MPTPTHRGNFGRLLRTFWYQMYSQPIERMELDNLPYETIQQFLADCLRLSLEEVTPLADGVYSQTKGNIFYTRQSLEHLQRPNALYLLSTSNPRWT
jgi:predicted ATPase